MVKRGWHEGQEGRALFPLPFLLVLFLSGSRYSECERSRLFVDMWTPATAAPPPSLTSAQGFSLIEWGGLGFIATGIETRAGGLWVHKDKGFGIHSGLWAL